MAGWVAPLSRERSRHGVVYQLGSTSFNAFPWVAKTRERRTMIRFPSRERKSILSVRPRRSTMKRIAGAMLALLFLLPAGISVIAAAQDKATMDHMPPKVLVVQREYTK